MMNEPTPLSTTSTLPPALDRTFRIIAFDWDGTAVVDRHADATSVTRVIDELLKAGVYTVPITGTNIGNMWGQCLQHISGPQKERLFACTNRGSEVWRFDPSSGEPALIYRREATPEELSLLDRVADRIKERIQAVADIPIDIVRDRMNRRKIDVIVDPAWADPPKSLIAELEAATQKRLKDAGFPRGMGTLFEIASQVAAEEGLSDARLTTDMKYLEVGLTDKGDSSRWVINELAPPNGIDPSEILFGGDEFGPLGEAPGSDYLMVVPEADDAVFCSVGVEPNGVVPPVYLLRGGPARFEELLRDQLKRHRDRQ